MDAENDAFGRGRSFRAFASVFRVLFFFAIPKLQFNTKRVQVNRPGYSLDDPRF